MILKHGLRFFAFLKCHFIKGKTSRFWIFLNVFSNYALLSHTNSDDPGRRTACFTSQIRSVGDLGVWPQTLVTSFTTTVIACFAAVRQIHSERHSLSRHALLSLLVHAMSLASWTDSYSPSCVFDKEVGSHHATTPHVRVLHRLKVPERIQFGLNHGPLLAHIWYMIQKSMTQHTNVPVHAQHCIILPHRITPTGCWCGGSTTSSLRRRLRDAAWICPTRVVQPSAIHRFRNYGGGWTYLPSAVRAAPSLASSRQKLGRSQRFPPFFVIFSVIVSWRQTYLCNLCFVQYSPTDITLMAEPSVTLIIFFFNNNVCLLAAHLVLFPRYSQNAKIELFASCGKNKYS